MLAHEALLKAGIAIPDWARSDFLLHYYGPSRGPDGRFTFRQIKAINVMKTASGGPEYEGAEPWRFKDKIVLIGGTAHATYDAKSTPQAPEFPGAEIHATAMMNMIEDQRVRVLGWLVTFAAGWAASMFAAVGTVAPKRAWLKLPAPLVALAAAFLGGYLLFVHGWNIYWLPLAAPLLATVLATLGGLAWTYLVEDRQKRVLRKFLAQYVSPEVAAELDRRGTISLGGVEREMSVVFTDIAGFTDLTEQLPVDQLERFMNYYLSEMSGLVFASNGTLDKYIGDAIMTFWNAPLDQPDHAIRRLSHRGCE